MTHLIRVRNDLQVLGCITSNNSLELQFWLPVTQNDELEAAGGMGCRHDTRNMSLFRLHHQSHDVREPSGKLF